jgi:hypothetical protein
MLSKGILSLLILKSILSFMPDRKIPTSTTVPFSLSVLDDFFIFYLNTGNGLSINTNDFIAGHQTYFVEGPSGITLTTKTVSFNTLNWMPIPSN